MTPLLAALAAFSLSSTEAPTEAPPARAVSPNAGATPIAGDAVFRAFHGKAGIDRVVADLLAQVKTDPRISDIFKASDFARLQAQLSDQVCYLTGGDCGYGGKTMREAHKDLGLQDADLNALVEDLQNAMDREHVAFGAQNRLLAKLAPMRRDVVRR